MRSFHLKGLNTYRAIAALVVLVSHVELFKKNYGFTHWFDTRFFKYTGGHIAVVLFFALSGFLITLLLLREKEKHQTISLKKFYMRRILRVWPLYYLVIILSLVLFRYSPSAQTLLLCVSIFPNIAYMLGQGWAVSPQIWSIGVEEQFYLVWPFLVKKTKYLVAFLLLVFIFFTLLPHGLLFLINRFHPDPEWFQIANNTTGTLKFNCMALGGFFAVAYHQKQAWLSWLHKSAVIGYAIIALPFVLWFAGIHLRFFTDELYALLFGLSVLVVSTSPNLRDIDTRVGNYLGNISYGIYMYHWIVLELIFRNRLWPADMNPQRFAVYVLVITAAATVLIAGLSYRYIEKPLLAIKDKKYGQ